VSGGLPWLPGKSGAGHRAWVFVTVLWCIGVGALAYYSVRDQISHWKWQYDAWMRMEPWKADWTRPYYENHRSPSAEKLAVTFSELDRKYIDEWNKSLNEGAKTIVSFNDGSILYLDAPLTEADQQYLAQAFWGQRWWRYAEIGKRWAAVLAGPPIALFIIGWGLLWVSRGFKTARP
jgi:hypothetical protein